MRLFFHCLCKACINTNTIGYIVLVPRYLTKSGHSIVVRPCAEPQGVKVFQFQWNRATKAVDVKTGWTGRSLCRVPGTWGPQSEFWQAPWLLSGLAAVCHFFEKISFELSGKVRFIDLQFWNR